MAQFLLLGSWGGMSILEIFIFIIIYLNIDWELYGTTMLPPPPNLEKKEKLIVTPHIREGG